MKNKIISGERNRADMENIFCQAQMRFSLSLSNGTDWVLVGTRGLADWLYKLASIMCLKNGKFSDGGSHIFFTEIDHIYGGYNLCSDINIVECVNHKGWQHRESQLIHLWKHPDHNILICGLVDFHEHTLKIMQMSYAISNILEHAVGQGGVPFHAALCEYRGKGIVLAGPGGIGKSTCTRRLRHPWEALSDDQVVVVKATNQKYFAHPFPSWSGHINGGKSYRKSWNVEKNIQLCAIFLLEQSLRNEVVHIEKQKAVVALDRSASEALRPLFDQVSASEARLLRLKIFDNICNLVQKIPVFKLRFSLYGRFWEKIEEVLELGPHLEEKEEKSEGVIYEGRSNTGTLQP